MRDVRSRLFPALFVLAACAAGAGTEDPGSLARRDAMVRDASQLGDVRAADATAVDSQVAIADALSGPDGTLATDGSPRDAASDRAFSNDVTVPVLPDVATPVIVDSAVVDTSVNVPDLPVVPIDAGCSTSSTLACTTTCGSSGVSTCTTGTWGVCAAPTETCNSADDDCDGMIDEGFRARIFDLRFSTDLFPLHEGCDGTTRRGLACNAAINRYCSTRGCLRTGFGPVSGTADEINVACVISENREVTYETLATYIPGCTGPYTTIFCNAAIHRYCAANGFASGFGPIEAATTVEIVSCVHSDQATVVATTFSVLHTYVASCDNATALVSEGCDHAAHAFCVNAGHATGFGPVEGAGDVAIVTCLDP